MYLKVLILGGAVGFVTGNLTWIGYLLFNTLGSKSAIILSFLILILGLVIAFKKYKFKGAAVFLFPWLVGFFIGALVLGPDFVGYFHHWNH